MVLPVAGTDGDAVEAKPKPRMVSLQAQGVPFCFCRFLMLNFTTFDALLLFLHFLSVCALLIVVFGGLFGQKMPTASDPTHACHNRHREGQTVE